jgi:hypothetical protein
MRLVSMQQLHVTEGEMSYLYAQFECSLINEAFNKFTIIIAA